ncbi:hypothetical protein [Deminuibacter soli]|uniref:Uncharacterized protein n=1 Tax=Deminuibacter soli TaxID=2291815 RepID=A0A3E1NRK2_9BACT|nr:hypothetical protein [Deminuibacter soli]RFM30543.1 hypothetical protein DXN05_06205 [Deminuibacter soli]
MSSLGKKLLSAFVEVTDTSNTVTSEPATQQAVPARNPAPPVTTDGKFKQYFDQLFKEANLPGPDYYEFSKMISAMQTIPYETARYQAAFAGLQVQGLSKEKLLQTAAAYIQLIDTDAANFNNTITATTQQKVHGKQEEINEKTQRIQQLSKEITDLHNCITLLQNELKENEEKITATTGGYVQESNFLKQSIQADIEKIKRYVAY